MKVRILTNISDRVGIHLAGDEPDLEDERATEYLASGIAESLSEETAPELAMLADTPERATLPRGKPRG